MQINKIINADSIEYLKTLDDNSFDLIFADPPYWMRTEGTLKRTDGTTFNGVYENWDKFKTLDEYKNFTYNWLKECKRVLKKDGSIWVIGGMQCIYSIGSIMQDLGFWIINDVIWHKKNPTPNFKGTRLNNSHETLIWASKDKNSKFTFNYKTAKELNKENVSNQEFIKGIRKQLGSIWQFSVVNGSERLKDKNNNKLHSTQKPEDLLYRIIAISSKIGDLILDPFGGTMTTACVAKRMGRKYLTIEKEKKYCDYGNIRLDNTFEDITDIERATYDKKPLKVSLKEMIKDGFLKENENLYLSDYKTYVNINSDGKIKINEKLYDIHTGAAILKKVNAEKLNGFMYWYVKRDDSYILIDTIRNNYRTYLLQELLL